MFKLKKLTAVVFVVAVCLCLLASLVRHQYVVPIIMYHSVNPDASWENRLTVSPQAFQRQMDFLKKNGYRVLPLEELSALIKNKSRIPGRTIAVTFDDGYKDNYVYAFPVLKKYGIPATIFVIISEIGRPDRLNWEEIREMQDSGLIVIGSHTFNPGPLTKIASDAELKKQISDSKKTLEDKLGKKINIFSYPEGRFNAKIRRMVMDSGYSAAVATNPGKRYPNNDVFALKRLRISENSKNLFIFWLETSGFYTFIKENRKK